MRPSLPSGNPLQPPMLLWLSVACLLSKLRGTNRWFRGLARAQAAMHLYIEVSLIRADRYAHKLIEALS